MLLKLGFKFKELCKTYVAVKGVGHTVFKLKSVVRKKSVDLREVAI
jgi:hypothetical protein